MNRCDVPTELDEERLRVVLSTCPPRDRLLVELGFETGLRLSELLSLKVEEVWRDGEPARVLRIGRPRLKGGKGRGRRKVAARVIPLNERARVAIAETSDCPLPERPFEEMEGWLFPSREGRCPLSRRQATRIIRALFLAASCSPDRVWAGHSLRKRYVTRIYQATGDINVARAAVGHRYITTTQAYLGLGEGEVEAAVLRIGAVTLSTPAPVVPQPFARPS